MTIINLTPHALNIVTPSGTVTVPPSGTVARCATASVAAGEHWVWGHGAIALHRTTYGEVQNLPEPVEGTLYIVSALVRAAVPGRTDVASPGELVRGPDGQPVGCKGLVVN